MLKENFYAERCGQNIEKGFVPRPEHPRPQWRRDEEDWKILNGEWDFEKDPYCQGEAKGFQERDRFSRKINVPFPPEAPLSGINEESGNMCLWYGRTENIPTDWLSGRNQVMLRFEGVDDTATIWVNGQPSASHIGGYRSFFTEISSLLQNGSNRIVVKAIDDMTDYSKPVGKQSRDGKTERCVYKPSSGIWRPVWMEKVPETYLQNAQYKSHINDKSVTVHMDIDGKTDGYDIYTRVLADGIEVGGTHIPAKNLNAYNIALSKIDVWEPGNPFLYDLEHVLYDRYSKKVVDKVYSYFGMREITIDGNTILLNGKPLFQNLFLDQCYNPYGLYTAPNDKWMESQIDRAMAMGRNGARIHQLSPDARLLHHANKKGFLIWAEYGNWDADHSCSKFRDRAVSEVSSIVSDVAINSSVITWVPLNETNKQDPRLPCDLYKAVKEKDVEKRPVIDASGWTHLSPYNSACNTYTDIYDEHNYSTPPEIAKRYEDTNNLTKQSQFPDQPPLYNGCGPVILSEAGGRRIRNRNENKEGDWGYEEVSSPNEFIDFDRQLMKAVYKCEDLAGVCTTQLDDTGQEQNGYYDQNGNPKVDPQKIYDNANSSLPAYLMKRINNYR